MVLPQINQQAQGNNVQAPRVPSGQQYAQSGRSPLPARPVQNMAPDNGQHGGPQRYMTPTSGAMNMANQRPANPYGDSKRIYPGLPKIQPSGPRPMLGQMPTTLPQQVRPQPMQPTDVQSSSPMPLSPYQPRPLTMSQATEQATAQAQPRQYNNMLQQRLNMRQTPNVQVNPAQIPVMSTQQPASPQGQIATPQQRMVLPTFNYPELNRFPQMQAQQQLTMPQMFVPRNI